MIRFLSRPPVFYGLMGVNLLVFIPMMIRTGSPRLLTTALAAINLVSLMLFSSAMKRGGRR